MSVPSSTEPNSLSFVMPWHSVTSNAMFQFTTWLPLWKTTNWTKYLPALVLY
jgi:hypothetical protein